MMSGWRETSTDVGLLWLRLLTGVTIAKIGYGKVIGGQIEQLIQGVTAMGFPAPKVMAWLAALSEFAGGILIAAGLGTRIASLFLFVTMCVAYFVAHAKDPFHMKISAYLYGVIAGGLIFTGAGKLSLDALFCRKK